jgi:cellulose synthase/poly-beta-1,6-N-acetylglucosamine synthase-like glycosyltransferase
VVVVDDGPRQPAAIAAICESDRARLLRLAHSRGPSAARNAALTSIRTELVAFVDSDTAPEHGWLEILARHFSDPTVGAAAPRVRPLAQGTSLLER